LRWWERLGFEDLRAANVEGMGKLLVNWGPIQLLEMGFIGFMDGEEFIVSYVEELFHQG